MGAWRLAGLALLLQAASVAHAEEGDNCTLTERPAKQVDAAPPALPAPRSCLPRAPLARLPVLPRLVLRRWACEVCSRARGARSRAPSRWESWAHARERSLAITARHAPSPSLIAVAASALTVAGALPQVLPGLQFEGVLHPRARPGESGAI